MVRKQVKTHTGHVIKRESHQTVGPQSGGRVAESEACNQFAHPLIDPDRVNLQAIRNPASLTSSEVLQLQRTIGDQAVMRLMTSTSKQSSKLMVQRHAPTAPADLVPKPVTGEKSKWSVGDFLSAGDIDNLKKVLQTYIPADAKPTPQERVNALNFIDHQNPDEMPGGGENAANAAKVTETGEVHINNTLNDYYNTDGSPNPEKIKSTIVHESFHAVSAAHTGLQEYANLIKAGSAQSSPDEAITEYFSLKAYQEIFGKEAKDYQTGYWVPVEGAGAVSPTQEKGELVRQQQLSAGWSGQMVGVLKEVLSIDDEKLKEIYFKDPKQFGSLIHGKEKEIKDKWGQLMGKQALERHGVLTKDTKGQILEDIIKEKSGELEGKAEAEWPALIKAGLSEKNVPKVDKVFSDVIIKKKVHEILKK